MADEKPKQGKLLPAEPAKEPVIGEAVAVIRIGGKLHAVSVPITASTKYTVLHETNSGPLAAKFFMQEILRRTKDLGLTRPLTVDQMRVPEVKG